MSTGVEAGHRLEIGHVLFMDVVGYSKLLLDEQREQQQHLTEIVLNTEQVCAAEAADKLIRLPVGDGMALVFFSSPEAPVRCAIEISERLKQYPQLKLRMGIHSGPVNEVRDVNDRANVAGAGINIAQRVMDCGDAGHILLSKRVAEDLAHSRQWRTYLHDLGECAVKHGVPIFIVNLYTDEIGNAQLPEKIKQWQSEQAAQSADEFTDPSTQICVDRGRSSLDRRRQLRRLALFQTGASNIAGAGENYCGVAVPKFQPGQRECIFRRRRSGRHPNQSGKDQRSQGH